ncbi:MAG: hypothetical protein EKK61_04760 [Rickettsiales bacterium]|nr:MAG: hypothetical protein EKK61_04760 [Rickettsiales bacterium]
MVNVIKEFAEELLNKTNNCNKNFWIKLNDYVNTDPRIILSPEDNLKLTYINNWMITTIANVVYQVL